MLTKNKLSLRFDTKQLARRQSQPPKLQPDTRGMETGWLKRLPCPVLNETAADKSWRWIEAIKRVRAWSFVTFISNKRLGGKTRWWRRGWNKGEMTLSRSFQQTPLLTQHPLSLFVYCLFIIENVVFSRKSSQAWQQIHSDGVLVERTPGKTVRPTV